MRPGAKTPATALYRQSAAGPQFPSHGSLPGTAGPTQEAPRVRPEEHRQTAPKARETAPVSRGENRHGAP